MVRKILLFSIFLATITLAAAQNKMPGQLYTVPTKNIKYSLDSVVGNTATGWIDIYLSVGGEGKEWDFAGEQLGHKISINIKDGTNIIFNYTLYDRYPKNGVRSLPLREVGNVATTTKTLSAFLISFDDGEKADLVYKEIPIIWRQPEQRLACRPAEFYLEHRDMIERKAIHNGTPVIPYTGKVVKKQAGSPGYPNYYTGESFNTSFQLVLCGVVGCNDGTICPIFSIKNEDVNSQTIRIHSVKVYDEDGVFYEIEKNNGYADFEFIAPNNGLWIEVNELTAKVTPRSKTLQKMIVTMCSGNSCGNYDHQWVFEYRDVPIQWIDVE